MGRKLLGREPGDGSHHYAGEELHGSNVACRESIGSGGENLEDAQRPAKMTQRGGQNGTDSQAMARGQIHLRIFLRIMAKHDLAGTDTIGGNPGVGLETNS